MPTSAKAILPGLNRNRRAVFWANGGPRLGHGHFSRCLTLARALDNTGWSCVFTRPDTPEAAAAAQAVGITDDRPIPVAKGSAVQSNDINAVVDGADLFVIDDYVSGASLGTAARDWVGSVLVIDDLADRAFDADLLLNQNPGFSDKDYDGLVPSGCRVLLGARYALLRPAFAAARTAALLARDKWDGTVRRVLISLGATDPDDITTVAFERLQRSFPDIRIDVVLSGTAPHLERVRDRVERSSRAVLHVDTPDMAALMAAADIGIGAGGTTSFERCCLGLPMVIVKTAENQARTIFELVAQGAVIEAADGTSAADTLTDLCHHPTRLRAIAAAAAAVCDGKGTGRLIEVIADAARE